MERREEAVNRWRAGRWEQRERGENGMRGWAERRNRRAPTKYGHLGEGPDSKRRTSAKVRPFQMGRLRA